MKLRNELDELRQAGLEANNEQLAEKLGLKPQKIAEMRQWLEGELSVDAFVADGDSRLVDLLSREGLGVDSPFSPAGVDVESAVGTKDLQAKVAAWASEFRKTIDERMQYIFDNRIYSADPISLQAIGDKHGISRERVRQIEKNLLIRLRSFGTTKLKRFDEIAAFYQD